MERFNYPKYLHKNLGSTIRLFSLLGGIEVELLAELKERGRLVGYLKFFTREKDPSYAHQVLVSLEIFTRTKFKHPGLNSEARAQMESLEQQFRAIRVPLQSDQSLLNEKESK